MAIYLKENNKTGDKVAYFQSSNRMFLFVSASKIAIKGIQD
jgi:hypothetical protein